MCRLIVAASALWRMHQRDDEGEQQPNTYRDWNAHGLGGT
jgi:hypothetical protein